MITDHNKKFVFVTNGYGKNHDMKVYRKSGNLQNYVEELPDNVWIVGDAAFRSIEKIKISENYANTDIFSSNCRKTIILIENAFGLIKGKFQKFDNP